MLIDETQQVGPNNKKSFTYNLNKHKHPFDARPRPRRRPALRWGAELNRGFRCGLTTVFRWSSVPGSVRENVVVTSWNKKIDTAFS